MKQEKLNKLVKYQSELKDKLANGKPHAKRGSPATYKQMIERELKTVTKVIDDVKVSGVSK